MVETAPKVQTPAENATSKTAWVQYAPVLSMILVYFGLDIPKEALAEVLGAIAMIYAFVTTYITVFLTKRVTEPVARMNTLMATGEVPMGKATFVMWLSGATTALVTLLYGWANDWNVWGLGG
jgi:hypothetical protein